MKINRKEFARKMASLSGRTIKSSEAAVRDFEKTFRTILLEGDDIYLSETLEATVKTIEKHDKITFGKNKKVPTYKKVKIEPRGRLAKF